MLSLGLPVPHGVHYPIQYENQPQQTCCAGCQAVAQTIIDSGQGAYYVYRTALLVTSQQIESELAQLGWYDLPEFQHIPSTRPAPTICTSASATAITMFVFC